MLPLLHCGLRWTAGAFLSKDEAAAKVDAFHTRHPELSDEEVACTVGAYFMDVGGRGVVDPTDGEGQLVEEHVTDPVLRVNEPAVHTTLCFAQRDPACGTPPSTTRAPRPIHNSRHHSERHPFTLSIQLLDYLSLVSRCTWRPRDGGVWGLQCNLVV